MKIRTLKIIAIIPTYNSWKTLYQCVNSLMKQSLELSEIIVVDNGSIDGTSKKVRAKFPQIKLICLDRNTGVTGGRNAGLKIINKKTDYVLFFDHDMVADKKMIEELLKVADARYEIGIVTPKIYYWDDKKMIWSAGTGINLWTGQVWFRGGRDIGQYQKIEEVQVAPAALLVKKKVIEKIGGFDDRYFATYEDTDFCFRARRAGFMTYYAPSAIAYHKIPFITKKERERLLIRSYWIGRNRILFMRDFGKNFYIFLLFIPIFIFYYFTLSFKHQRIIHFLDFIKGTIMGLFNI